MSTLTKTWLTETDELARELDAPDLVIIDASWHMPSEGRAAHAEYLQEHIPGAIFFDIDEIADTKSELPHMLPPPEKFSSRMRSMGVGDGARVVVYDSRGLFSAARVWWTFRVMGVEDVSVLDGGLPKWKAEGRPLESGAPPHRTARHFTARRNLDLVRDVSDVKKIIKDKSAEIVDARAPERFAGTVPEPRPGLRSGHIPGARNVPFSRLLNKDGTLKSPDELERAFAEAKVDLSKPVVASCGSGITASVLALALAEIGHRRAAVYDGSWSEWGRRSGPPHRDRLGARLSKRTRKQKDDTRLAHAGREPALQHGFVNTPIYRGSTVLFPTVAALEANAQDFTYGRLGTPTVKALEDAIAELEGGHRTLLAPSGLSAIATALLAFVSAGDEILVSDAVYRPTRRFCDSVLKRLGVKTIYYDPLIGAGIEKLITKKTRVVFTESPGSQTFEVQDVPAIAEAAHKAGAVVILDNTWATPLFFKPFEHGADVSIQAATKYIVGHADAMLGAITTTDATTKAVAKTHEELGICPGPEDVYLGLRGLRSLGVRLDRHQRSGLEMANWLAARPEVARVLHPALPSDPGHAVWQRDFTGASGLFSIVLKPVSHDALARMLDGLKLFGMGYSWGGFESLIVPFDPSAYRTATKWKAEGPALRLHIGLEDVGDLKADLDAGFARLAGRA